MQKQPDRRLNEVAAKFIINQIHFGLKYLHDADIAHGGLKPENVLIRDDGYLVLVDHGLAQMLKAG